MHEELDKFLENGVMLFDDEGILEQEWQNVVGSDHCLDLNLKDWLADQEILGRVLYVKQPSDVKIKRQLRNLSVVGHDCKFIILAYHGGASGLSSEDCDFYDPAAKRQSASVRDRCIKNSKGPVASYIRKKLHIHVFPISQINSCLKQK